MLVQKLSFQLRSIISAAHSLLKTSIQQAYDAVRGDFVVMNLTINLSVWGVILAITIALWLYRRFLENHQEDHYIHLHGDEHDAKVLQQQTVVGKRVDTLCRTYRILIALLIVYGLTIAAFEIYRAWNTSGI